MPEMQDLLVAAFQSQMNNVYTQLPCIVVQVQGPDRVAIQPAINQKLKDGSTKERPTIVNVPICFPVSKTAGMTFPIKPGDTGIAFFSMRSIEAWKNSDGYPSTPLNYSKMDKQDAMFLPGLQTSSTSSNNPAKHSWSHSIEDTVVFAGLGTGNEVEVRLQPSGNVLIRTNQDVSVECDNASVVANTSASITTPELSIDAQNTTWIGDCTWTGNVTHLGTFTFNSIPFATHKHAGVQTGTGTSGTPVP